ncbi:four-carbon acid sugar kinase family protein [Pleomorphomonas sp. NRK KF1]|uniref:four-carbon acid sugar kinase family protein n=1 Tax=Pleomorphomonas sp. NRK KF1 TaxID=2943000 RepID=UPI002042FABB|nr:four-carbon acid sugar kinase family protein [Pleomorphomonas sp. NRK KF1]MCM5554808.1 four-carbon acid sugar kinase family protein [Pleomorphomonas sp. NRK KF1]
MMQNEKIAIIADDYTGAGDAGIHFARFGRKIELLLHADAIDRRCLDNTDIALTSETRFLNPAEAGNVVLDMVRRCRAVGYERIFKKIDSTMRGNPGSEVEAVLLGTGLAAALICTAMPKTGRTCADGVIYLDGVPLHLSEIGRDPFHPLSSSNVADLLRLQTDLPIGFIGLKDIEAGEATLRRTIASMLDRGVRLIVADAVEDGHLAALAQQLKSGDLLPVGAGGFAEALARLSAPEGLAVAARRVALHRPIVSVVGSLTEVSRRQATHADKSGLFRTIDIRSDAPPADIRSACEARLSEPDGSQPNILLRVVNGERSGKISREDGERVAEKLGYATASICDLVSCRTIVSTGGSTSMAVAEALGIESVDLIDEIMPGIVVGACNRPNGDIEWFISKAGGFGDESLLTEIDARCIGA